MQRIVVAAELRRLIGLWAALSSYIAAVQAAHYWVSPTADLDQAEQLIVSRSFALGYGAQPPLYTYIVALAFAITGPSLATLLAIKAALLMMLVGTLIGIGHRLAFTPRQQLLSMSGLAYLPHVMWESQRDLTHSVLAALLAALTALHALNMRDGRTRADYLLWGALIGAGLLSKYNYALTLASVFASMIVIPSFARIVSDRRILLTVFVASALAAPHAVWVAENPDLALSAAHKLQADSGNAWSGIATAAVAAVAFLTPLWLFALALCSNIRREALRRAISHSDATRFLFRLLPSAGLVIAAFVLASGAQEIRERWYLPILIFSPVIVAALARDVDGRRSRFYIGTAAALALGAAIFLPARVVAAAHTGKHARQNIPYADALAAIGARLQPPAFVIADSKMLGGNARLVFPNATIIAARVNAQAAAPVFGRGVVMCETADCGDPDLREWLLRVYDIDLASISFHTAEAPFYYDPGKTLKLYWAEVSLSRAAPVITGRARAAPIGAKRVGRSRCAVRGIATNPTSSAGPRSGGCRRSDIESRRRR